MTLGKDNRVSGNDNLEPQPNTDYEKNYTEYNDQQQVIDSEIQHIELLEEKLQVARHRKKVGEVVVRKKVETRIIEVPIRREKLVIERIGETPEQLTEVVIGEEKVNGFTYEQLKDSNGIHVTKSHFLDLQTAQYLLEALAQLSATNDAKIRIEVVTNSSENQIEYQKICDRYK